MTSRERVLAAIDHKPVDRVPLDMTISYTAHNNLCRYMNWDHLCVKNASIWSVAFPDPEFHEKMNIDCVYVGLNPPSGIPPLQFNIDETYTNEFGQSYRKTITSTGAISYDFTNAPAEDWTLEDLENWQMPDPLDEAIFEGLYERCKYIYENTDKALVGYFGGSLFSVSSHIRGMENWYVDLMTEPEFTGLFMRKFLDYYAKMYNKALDIAGKYISFLRTEMDDFASQQGPLISPLVFREQVKPLLGQFYAGLKAKFAEVNPQGRLMKHACGDNSAFIDDYIDIGVNMLDPVQPNTACMTRDFLSKYKGRIAFHGNINTQQVMPYGTVEEVWEDVKDSLRHLAGPSGFICGPTHHILGGVPPENIIALRDAVLEMGQVKDGVLVNLG
ncbi:MAG: hypothetical protein LBL20_07190 [Treponema sp.]|nr:hypothetical protein [Treponema sp.]